MALADDPRDHILHMFRMEAHGGGGAHCRTYPDGAVPANLPLEPGERVFGVYQGTYHFTDRALVITSGDAPVRIKWSDVKKCSTDYGDPKGESVLRMRGGAKIVVDLTDMRGGGAGRITQLYHAKIERWGGATGGPLLPIEAYFARTEETDLAPNLDPHPGKDWFRRELQALRDEPDVEDVLIAVDSEKWLDSDRIVIVSRRPAEGLESLLSRLRADGLNEADRNQRKKVGSIPPDCSVYEIVWD